MLLKSVWLKKHKFNVLKINLNNSETYIKIVLIENINKYFWVELIGEEFIVNKGIIKTWYSRSYLELASLKFEKIYKVKCEIFADNSLYEVIDFELIDWPNRRFAIYKNDCKRLGY